MATNYGVRCNKCGHRMLITNKYGKIPCSWCGNMIFKDKKTEFEFRLKEKMRKYERSE